MKYKKILTLIVFFISSIVWAQPKSGFNSSKRPWLLSNATEAQAANRFSLAEWLDTKNRNNSMDMWLGYNTIPNYYEFMLRLSMNEYDNRIKVAALPAMTNAYKSYDGSFTAYAKNVGLTAEYQNNKEENFDDVTGLFNFRLFGRSLQTSHLTLHYGLRTRNSTNNPGGIIYRLNHQFPAATLQLYLVENFGIFGHYRKYLKSTETVYGETEGSEAHYGAFIEYGRFRIFGNIFDENQISILNGINTEINRKGTKIGIQLHF